MVKHPKVLPLSYCFLIFLLSYFSTNSLSQGSYLGQAELSKESALKHVVFCSLYLRESVKHSIPSRLYTDV